MANFSPEELDQLRWMIDKNPVEAFKLLLHYESKYPDDGNLQRNAGGYLIDIGQLLSSTKVVESGIARIHQVLPTLNLAERYIYLFNLGNGYAAIHSIASRAEGYEFDPDTSALIQAKSWYREALKVVDPNNSITCAEIHVNLGNCLSGIGRSVESISEYETALEFAPQHPMALGNLGMKLEHFARIAYQPELLEDASNLLATALAGNELEQLGQSNARNDFEPVYRRIQDWLNSPNGKISPIGSPPESIRDLATRKYTDFCARYGLFLNFCLQKRPCRTPVQDSISFSLLGDLDDEMAFARLARVLNEVKERYALARLLVYEAHFPPVDTVPYDGVTYYVDNLDYAVYGIRAAKLKSAFEGAFNILDKVAFFLNDYLGLGMREQDVNFGSIWKESKQKDAPLKPDILRLQNFHLFGLYDISRDLAPGGFSDTLRNIRNSLTHRYLVPHSERIEWLESADSPKYHLGYREFFDRTIELLQLVRSAAIYLIAFIEQEEEKKHKDARGAIQLIQVQPYRPRSIGPEDSTV